MALNQLAADQTKYDIRTALLALSAALLGIALHLNDGLYRPDAVLLLLAALGLCVVCTITSRAALKPISASLLGNILITLVATQLIFLAIKRPGASAATVPIPNLWPSHAGVLLASLALALIGWGRQRIRLLGFVILLIVHAALGIWKIQTAPHPRIDVFTFQVDAAAALAAGHNPYALTFPDIYGPGAAVYAPELVQNGRLHFGYPYPPLVLLFTAPLQWLLGDFRYAELLAMLVAAVLIASLAADRIGMLAAALLLFTPRSFYVLEMGWIEPLAVMLLAATLVCATRWPRLVPIFFGLLIASKQYLPAMVALIPLLETSYMGSSSSNPNRSKCYWIVTATICLAVGAIVTLPLALGDLPAFLRSTIWIQLRQPYRADSLSFLAWWGSAHRGWTGPSWLAFILFIAGIAISLPRARRGNFGFAAAAAMCYFAFFAFNKQAFANYYYLVIGALCCAIASGKLHATDEACR